MRRWFGPPYPRMIVAELDQDLADKIAWLRQASGAPKTELVRSALREFIDKVLKENINIRERYEKYKTEDEARAKAKASKHSYLKVIK